MKLFYKYIFALFVFCSLTFAQPLQPCEWYGMYNCNSFEGNNFYISYIESGLLSAFYWPNDGSGRDLFWQSSMSIGTLIDNNIKVSKADGFPSGNFLPGPFSISSVTDSISNPKYRVYKIQKNWESLPESEIKDDLEKDYIEWPIELGAPVDANNKPLIFGDQMLWMIYHDKDSSKRTTIESSPLLGEYQTMIWGFKDDEILRNTVFYKQIVKNKNSVQWRNTFIGNIINSAIHVSPSLPTSYSGTDSIIGLGYLYNYSSNSFISPLYGKQIPAVGTLLLQGPLIEQLGSKGFQSGKIVNDKTNLSASSALRFLLFRYLDQPDKYRSPNSYPERYSTLRGLWQDNTPIRDPVTNKILRFAVPGDPVAGTGWTDISESTVPYFRYVQVNVGPFDLAPEESQEIIGAIVVGQGRDQLQSINILKHHSRYVKSVFPFLFGASLPISTVAAASLNGKILLSWDNNAESELPPLSTYSFQGYYVYQGESSNGPWHKIATFDKNDDVVLMVDEVYSSKTYSLSDVVIDELPNKGLQHFLTVDRDTLGRSHFINGRPYHFAVEPFWYDTESRPMYKAGKKIVQTIVPQPTVPGSVFQEPSSIIPHDRKYDDAVQMHIVDPLKIKTNKYTVSVSMSFPDSAIRWTLSEEPNTIILKDQTDTTGRFSNPVIDGFTLTVKKPWVGLRRDSQSPQGWKYHPDENRFLTGAAPQLIMDGLNGGIVYPTPNNYMSKGTTVKPDQLKQIMIRFGESQKAYRYATKVRPIPFSDGPRDPSFAPFIKNRGSLYVYQDFVDVPFTVWEIDSLDGDPTPKQLNAAFVETNDSLYSKSGKYLGLGNLNGEWKPTTAVNGGDERLYIFASPYSSSPSSFYTSKNLITNADSLDIYYVLVTRADTTLRKDKKDWFSNGDKLILTPNQPLINNRVFHYSTFAPTVANASLAKQQGAMNGITVFPNPYLGGHSLETSLVDRFVTLSGLPSVCIIRIFNIAGRMIRTIHHNTTSTSLERWDLRNDEGIKVASGLYVIHIDAPEIGTKILKLMVLYPDERVSAH